MRNLMLVILIVVPAIASAQRIRFDRSDLGPKLVKPAETQESCEDLEVRIEQLEQAEQNAHDALNNCLNRHTENPDVIDHECNRQLHDLVEASVALHDAMQLYLRACL